MNHENQWEKRRKCDGICDSEKNARALFLCAIIIPPKNQLCIAPHMGIRWQKSSGYTPTAISLKALFHLSSLLLPLLFLLQFFSFFFFSSSPSFWLSNNKSHFRNEDFYLFPVGDACCLYIICMRDFLRHTLQSSAAACCLLFRDTFSPCAAYSQPSLPFHAFSSSTFLIACFDIIKDLCTELHRINIGFHIVFEQIIAIMDMMGW